MPYSGSGVSSPLPHRSNPDPKLRRPRRFGCPAGARPRAAHGAHDRRTAAQVWNLCVVSLFAALLGSRLLLVFVNWKDILHHPLWILSLAMVHHPLLAAAGAVVEPSPPCSMRAGNGCLWLPLPTYWRRPWLSGWPSNSGAPCWPAPVTGWRPPCAGPSSTPIPWPPAGAARLWAFRCIRAGLRVLAYFTLTLWLVIWLPARLQQGESGWIVVAGHRRDLVHYRILAGSRRTRLRAGRCPRWPADRRHRARACRRRPAARTQKCTINSRGTGT